MKIRKFSKKERFENYQTSLRVFLASDFVFEKQKLISQKYYRYFIKSLELTKKFKILLALIELVSSKRKQEPMLTDVKT